MAKLIDTDGTVVAETTEFDDLVEQGAEEEREAVEAEAEVVEAHEQPEEQEDEDDLPEKYRGKSAADIAKMHRELESRLGQQSQEVGELRRAFDEMVQGSIAAQNSSSPEPEAIEDMDFFADPSSAVRRAIENHPSLKQAQAVAAEMKKSQSLAKLKATHPDMDTILSEDGFKDWVQGSNFRRQMYQQADQQYDFEAANELLTLYKDRKGVVSQTKQVEKVAQKQAVKKASTGSSRTSAAGKSPKKTYRRADIIELMKTNPKRYEALSDEIMRAYAEGRVK
jgi:hypothetical protein